MLYILRSYIYWTWRVSIYNIWGCVEQAVYIYLTRDVEKYLRGENYWELQGFLQCSFLVGEIDKEI